MANVIIRMDENFKAELSQRAQEMGLSLSAFIRSTMKEKVKQSSIKDRLLLNSKDDEVVSYNDFKKDLKEMIANARD